MSRMPPNVCTLSATEIVRQVVRTVGTCHTRSSRFRKFPSCVTVPLTTHDLAMAAYVSI